MSKLIKKIMIPLITLYVELIKLFCSKNSETDIWLICETESQAQDNGYYFFKYMREKYPSKEIYYVINKNSKGYIKVSKLGNVLTTGSINHIKHMLKASAILSTHGMWMIPPEIGMFRKHTKKMIKAKKIMLQHGITAIKNIDRDYNKKKFAMKDGFVVASDFEKNIVVNHLGYDESEVLVVGFPRLDSLKVPHKVRNSILYMPTYRKGIDRDKDKFLESKFYKKTKQLLASNRLKEILEANGLELEFYLHQNFQKYKDCYAGVESNKIKIIGQEEIEFQTLLQENKILITDYSSVAFDFLYLEKPTIFYQFDLDEFKKERENPGYIDVEKELIGRNSQTIDETLKFVCHCIESNYQVEEKYKKRIKRHFNYFDTNNSKRLYRAIVKLIEE